MLRNITVPLFIFLLCIHYSQQFDIQPVTLSVTPSVINSNAVYKIFANRAYSPAGSSNNWSPNMQASDTIVIQFPSQYSDFTSDYTCSTSIGTGLSVFRVCSSQCVHTASTKYLTISGCFTSNISGVETVQITITNVRNPSPAITTGYFYVTIGSDKTSAGSDATTTLTTATATACSVTFSPGYMNKTTGSMVVSITPKNTIPLTGTVLITFPLQNYWTGELSAKSFGITSSLMTCSTSVAGGSISCQGDASARTIRASGLFSADTSSQFTITIDNIRSPPSPANTDKITFLTNDGTDSIDTCSSSVTGLLPNPLTFTITAATSQTINLQTPLTFAIQLADTIASTVNSLTFVFPSGSTFSGVSVSSTVNTGTVTLAGTTVSVPFTGTFSRNAGVIVSITLSTFINPTSIAPITVTTNILNSGSVVQTGTAQYAASSTTLSFTVSASPLTVNLGSQYTFALTLPDKLSAAGMIDIAFPSTVTFNSPDVVSVTGTNVSMSAISVTVQTGHILRISGFGTGLVGGSANILTFVIGGLVNPPSTAPTQSFTVTSYYTSSTTTKVSGGTSGSITATTGTINSNTISVVASDETVKASPVTYTVNFVNNNGAIPNGGKVILRFPPDILAAVILGSFQCSLTVGGTSALSFCVASTVSSQIQVKFTTSSIIAKTSTISLQVISSLINPSSTKTVSSFAITTTDAAQNPIESLTSGIGATMKYSSKFSSVEITSDSKVNSAITTYRFVITQPSAIETGGILRILFPATVIPQTSVTCTPLCTLSASTLRVVLTATAESTSFTVVVNNVKNPPSFAPSGMFSFYSYASDGVSAYSNDSSHNIQNNVYSTISSSSVTYSFSPRIYGSTATSLSISFTPTFSTIASIKISLNGDFSFSSPQCTATSGISGIDCTNSANIITVTGTFSGSSFGLILNGLTSPKQSTSQATLIETFDAGTHQIDYFSGLTFTTACTLPCKQCFSIPTNCTSCYNDDVITPQKYYNSQQHICTVSCEEGYYQNSGTVLTCSACATTCKSCSMVNNNCTSCKTTGSTPYHDTSGSLQTCNSTCSGGYYADTSTYTCLPCSTQCKTCIDSPSKCTSCNTGYYYPLDNTCPQICPTGISILVGTICTPCASVCVTCYNSITQCATCAPNAARSGTTCVTDCPNDDQIILNSVCVKCNYPCSKCSVARDNCTSCISTSDKPLYHNYQCWGTCPVNYFNASATGNCISCASYSTLKCANCYYQINTPVCTDSCIDNYIYYNNNKSCLSVAPSGYVNISGRAQPCASTCQTCGPTQQTCLTCTNSLYRYQSNCVAASSCPGGTVPISNKCEPCSPNCATCSSSTTKCDSCNYPLYKNGNLCQNNCPDTTFKNDTSRQCQNCESNCNTCETSSKCLTCKVNFYWFQNTCKPNCPSGYTGLATNCQPCNPGCSICTSSVSYCQNCTTGYYHVPSSFTCVQTCPTGLYPYDTNQTCIGCLSPCKTCNSIPTNCTSCTSGGLLGNQCYQTCPSSHYLFEQKCVSCVTGCATCSSATVCISCSVGYFFYLSSCLEHCPANRPVITVNGTCAGCSTAYCAQCSSRDSCFLCQSTKLVYSNECIDVCPTNYQTNGTHCVLSPAAKSLADSLKDNGVVPLPFTIGTVLIIIICLFSKFTCPTTFFTGAIYAIIGLLEPAVHAYFIYLLWIAKGGLKDLIVLLSIGSIACLYFVNFISIIVVNYTLCKDLRFKQWFNTKSGKCSYIIFNFLSITFSFKVMNIIFCKLFNLNIFKCKLQHPTRLFCLQLMSFLAITHSIWAMVMAAYNLYYIKDIATMLFFESIDLIAIAAIELIVGFFNIKKDDNFFDNYEDPLIGKKVQVQDSMNTLIEPFSKNHNERRKGGKYKIETKDSIQGEQLVSQQIEEDEQEDNMGMMPSKYKHSKRIMKKKNVDKYEELSERSNMQSVGDPSSRLINQTDRNKRIRKNRNPRVNYQQISVDFRGETDRESNFEELGTEGNLQEEGIETIDINNVKKIEDRLEEQKKSIQKSNIEKSKIDNLSKNQSNLDKTPTKLKKSKSQNQQLINKSKLSGDSNKLLNSVEQSDSFGNKIEESPLNPNDQKLKPAEELRPTPPMRKRTLEQDVEEFEWEEQNNNNNTISPKKKKSKFELGGDDIKDISGISEEGRENMLRLKYQMENRKIDENSKQYEDQLKNMNFNKKKGGEEQKSSQSLGKDLEQIPLNYVFEEKSKNLLEQSKQQQLEPSQNLQNSNDLELEYMKQGHQPFKKNKKHNATLFSNQKISDDRSQNQQGSTFMKNSQTMDKSIDESDDDINNFPAYMKYKKTLEDNMRPDNSNQFNREPKAYGESLNNLHGTQQNFTDQEYLQNSQDEDFPDELSRELYRYRKKQSGRMESGKQLELNNSNNKQRFLTSARGNKSGPFLKPLEMRGNKRINTSETQMILEEGQQFRSLEKIPENPNFGNQPSGISSKRPKHSSVGKLRPIKDRKMRNGELERIYLGSVEYEK